MKRLLASLCLLVLLTGCTGVEQRPVSPADIWSLGYGKSEEDFIAALSLESDRDYRPQDMPGVAPGRASYELTVPIEFGGESVYDAQVQFADYKLVYASYHIDFSDTAGKSLRDAYDFMERQCEELEKLYGPSIYMDRYGDGTAWWGEDRWSYENLEASVKRKTYSGRADLFPLPDGCYLRIGLAVPSEAPEQRYVAVSYQPLEENALLPSSSG